MNTFIEETIMVEEENDFDKLIKTITSLRQWYTDITTRTMSRSEGDKLMKKHIDSVERPQTRSCYDERELQKELTEWEKAIHKLASHFKEAGCVVISNSILIETAHNKLSLKSEFPKLLIAPPQELAHEFYAAVGDRVRHKKGSKRKTGRISSISDDRYQEVCVLWDDGTEDSGFWCGKHNNYHLVYAKDI